MSKITTQYIMKLTAGNPSEVHISVLVEEEFKENEDIDRIVINKLGNISPPTLPEPRVIAALKSPDQHKASAVSHVQPPADRRQQRLLFSAEPSTTDKPSPASKPATLNQLATVRKICAGINMSEDDLCERFHISSLEALNNGQVQEVFDMQKKFKGSLG